MKSILIIAEYFRPGYKAGGPIKSIYNLSNALKNDFNVHVLTRNHDLGEDQPYKLKSDEWVDIKGIKVFYSSKGIGKKVLNQIDLKQFDCIYFNSLFSTSTIKYLSRNQREINKIFISPRGELGEGALNIKPLKKKLFLRLSRFFGLLRGVKFIASSHEEVNNIKKWYKNDVIIISNLSDISDYGFVNNKRKQQINLFFVSRFTKKKNLLFLLDVLSKIKTTVTLKVIGPLEDEEYVKKCENKISKLSDNITVEILGSKKPTEIYNIIKNDDYFVLPTLNENYGHVIAEALSYKKPVIISDQTPWTKYINKNNLGTAIPLDKDIWEHTLKDYSAKSHESYIEYADNFNEIDSYVKFENQKIINRYKELFND